MRTRTVEVIIHEAAIVDGLSGITNTNANGQVVHLGVTPGYQYTSDFWDGEVEIFHQWFAWNAANFLDNQVC